MRHRLIFVSLTVVLLGLIVAPAVLGQASTAPATAPAEQSDAARIASNFLVLMGDTWGDVALFVGSMVLWAVVWAAGMFFAGIAAGLVVWLLLRRFGLFDARWGWYRWVRWLWPVLFVLSMSIGFCYAGAWMGLGRTLRGYIVDRHMVDKVVGHLWVAIALDSAQYEASGVESVEQLEAVLSDSDAVTNATLADWQAMEDELLADANFAERWVYRLTTDSISDRMKEDLAGADPRVVVMFFMDSPNLEQHLAEHPDAHVVVMALSTQMQAAREKVADVVDSFISPNVHTGLWAGLLIPVGLAVLFRVIAGATGGRRFDPEPVS